MLIRSAIVSLKKKEGQNTLICSKAAMPIDCEEVFPDI